MSEQKRLAKFWSAVLAIPLAIYGTAPTLKPTVAWPRLIMFYGGALGDGRRYVTDHGEVERFMRTFSTPATETHEALAARRFVEVGFYWYNPTWGPYAADTTLLKTLPLPDRNKYPPQDFGSDHPVLVEPARLYLAKDSSPALLESVPGPTSRMRLGLRVIDADGLKILQDHGVPTRDK